MAKYERNFKGDFDNFVNHLDKNIMNKSASASYEDGSNISMGDTRVAVRVYERYSMIGGNRVSLNITVVAKDKDVFVSAITSGGSQAVIFKINTIGEESFLSLCAREIDNYIEKNNKF